MSKINGCQLDRVGDLPFEFHYGACTNFVPASEKILLCFDVNQLKTCHIFDGMNFESGPHKNETTPLTSDGSGSGSFSPTIGFNAATAVFAAFGSG